MMTQGEWNKREYNRLFGPEDTQTKQYWTPNKQGKQEWYLHVDRDKQLTMNIRSQGTMSDSKFDYVINGEWIVKRPRR